MGKTIGGQGRLTAGTLQNYYGDAIRRQVGNVEVMMKAVQATLFHVNSSDETPRHQLCPLVQVPGSQTKGEVEQFQHANLPCPQPSSHFSSPSMPAWDLGSFWRSLSMATPRMQESHHNLAWRMCPKITKTVIMRTVIMMPSEYTALLYFDS